MAFTNFFLLVSEFSNFHRTGFWLNFFIYSRDIPLRDFCRKKCANIFGFVKFFKDNLCETIASLKTNKMFDTSLTASCVVFFFLTEFKCIGKLETNFCIIYSSSIIVVQIVFFK
jgi:hypothetical protein